MVDLHAALQSAETVAVVGCSPRATRTSHKIARYLQEAGYRVVPINPYHDELLERPCYPDLQHVPEHVRIDVANIFRRPEHTAQMVRDAVERAKQTGERPVIWTQLGVSTAEARALAQEAGLPYVQNRCIMVEHSRLL